MIVKTLLRGSPLAALGVLAFAALYSTPHRDLGGTSRIRTLVFEGARYRTFIPICSNSADDARVYDLVLEPLLRMGNDGRVVGALAETYSLKAAEIFIFPSSVDVSDRDRQLQSAMVAIQARPASEGFRVIAADRTARPAPFFPAPWYVDAIPPGQVAPSNDSSSPSSAKEGVGNYEVFHTALFDQDLPYIHLRVENLDSKCTSAISALEDACQVRAAIQPVISVTLRYQARFHDLTLGGGQTIPGRFVTTADVEFSVRLAQAHDSLDEMFADAFINPNMQADAGLIREVRGNADSGKEARDERTLEIVLHRPSGKQHWALTQVYIVPSSIYDLSQRGLGSILSIAPESAVTYGKSILARWPVGTGPFRMLGHDPNRVQLQRIGTQQPTGDASPIEYLEFRFVPDSFSRQIMAWSGEVDVLLPRMNQVHVLERHPKWRAFPARLLPESRYYFLSFNMRRRLFSGGPESAGWCIREALSRAIPYDRLNRLVFKGLGERITGPFHPSAPWYNTDIEAKRCDPVAAAALLRRAGWALGDNGQLANLTTREAFPTIDLVTSGGRDPAWVDAQTVIKTAWEALGVPVKASTLEWNTYLETRIVPFDFDTCIIGIETSQSVPRAEFMWHSRSGAEPGGYNISNFGAVDELVTEFERTVSPEARAALGRRIHSAIDSWTPYAFLMIRKDQAFVRRNIAVMERGAVMPLQDFPYISPVQAITSWVRVPGGDHK